MWSWVSDTPCPLDQGTEKSQTRVGPNQESHDRQSYPSPCSEGRQASVQHGRQSDRPWPETDHLESRAQTEVHLSHPHGMIGTPVGPTCVDLLVPMTIFRPPPAVCADENLSWTRYFISHGL